jgi:hypothetical protein
MTSKGNGQRPRYHVIMSEQTKAKLKQLHLQALQRGTGHQFLDALRLIISQLRDTPSTFGEPLYAIADSATFGSPRHDRSTDRRLRGA